MKIYEIQTKYKAVGTLPDSVAFTEPSGIVKYLKGAFDKNPFQEQFWCIFLNGANKPIGRYLCTVGIVNQTVIHAREVFKMAIHEGATSIILAHNHPSGECVPSNEDYKVTEKLCDVGEIVGINVLDHIVMGDNKWTSSRSSRPHYFK
jgi:DNA repair protein RadC